MEALFSDHHRSAPVLQLDVSDWEVADADVARLHAETTVLKTRRCGALTAAGLGAVGLLAQLTHLDVSGCRGVGDAALEALAAGPAPLAVFAADDSGAGNDGCLALLRAKSGSLRRLSLDGCAVGDRVLHAAAELTAEAGMRLRHLSLCRCPAVSDVGAVLALGSVSTLESLRLAQPHSASCITGATMHEGALEEAPAVHLNTLDLSGLLLPTQALRMITGVCASLVELRLAGCGVTDAALALLGARLRWLETLDVSRCPDVSDVGVRLLAGDASAEEPRAGLVAGAGCQRLLRLDLSGCFLVSDAGLTALGHSLSRSLLSLRLAGLSRVSWHGLRSVVHGSCGALRELAAGGARNSGLGRDFYGTPFCDANLLAAVAQLGGSLRQLSLQGANHTSEAGLRAMLLALPALRELDLSGCAVTDRVAAAAGATCAELRVLALARCKALGDEGVCAVARGCAQLAALDVQYARRVGDTALRALARGCPRLRSLNAVACWEMTGAGLAALARGCPRLHQLNVSRCPEVDRDDVLDMLPFCVTAELSARQQLGLAPKPANVAAVAARETRWFRAASAIQRFLVRELLRWHCKRERRALTAARRAQEAAALRLQRLHRGNLGRRVHRRLLRERERLHRSVGTRLAAKLERVYVAYRRRQIARGYRYRAAKAAKRARELKAATLLQRVGRGWLARRVVAGMRRELWAAGSISGHCRRFLARARRRERRALRRQQKRCAEFDRRRVALERRLRAAVRLQAFMRMATAVRRVSRLKVLWRAEQGRRASAVEFLQRCYRYWFGFKSGLKRLREDTHRKVSLLQALARGQQARARAREWIHRHRYACPVPVIASQARCLFTAEFAAYVRLRLRFATLLALKLQALFRGRVARAWAHVLAARRAKELFDQHTAALAIQYVARKFLRNRFIWRVMAIVRTRIQAARRIQAAWRSWATRAEVMALRRTARVAAAMGEVRDAVRSRRSWRRHRLLQHGAAHALQAWYRGVLQRRRWEPYSAQDMYNEFVTRIQTAWRGYVQRTRFRARFRRTREAALDIQRAWRGKCGRRRWQAAMGEARAAWGDQKRRERAVFMAANTVAVLRGKELARQNRMATRLQHRLWNFHLDQKWERDREAAEARRAREAADAAHAAEEAEKEYRAGLLRTRVWNKVNLYGHAKRAVGKKVTNEELVLLAMIQREEDEVRAVAAYDAAVFGSVDVLRDKLRIARQGLLQARERNRLLERQLLPRYGDKCQRLHDHLSDLNLKTETLARELGWIRVTVRRVRDRLREAMGDEWVLSEGQLGVVLAPLLSLG